MRDTTKVLIAVVVTAVLVGGGAAIGSGGSGTSGSSASSGGGAAANGSSKSNLAPRAAFGGGAGAPAFGLRGGPHLGGPGLHGGLDAAAAYLGLTEDALHTQLESGKTLAQVAQAQGKSVAGLKDAIVADAKSHLDDEVAAGRLTQAQASQLLDELKSHVDDLVNGTLPMRPGGPGGHHGGPGVGHGLDAAATYLGLTEDALHAQLQAGKTLAQVAQAQGKSVQGLEDAIVADAKSHLDAAVAAGRITQAQATQMLADLKSRVDDLVNGKLPAPGSFRGRLHAPPATITA
jgi:predicted XRE-type DNA-binding protein